MLIKYIVLLIFLRHVTWKSLPVTIIYLKTSLKLCYYLDLITVHNVKQNRNSYRYFTYLRIACKHSSIKFFEIQTKEITDSEL